MKLHPFSKVKPTKTAQRNDNKNCNVKIEKA